MFCLAVRRRVPGRRRDLRRIFNVLALTRVRVLRGRCGQTVLCRAVDCAGPSCRSSTRSNRT